jgi:hypothetical protein
VPNVSTVETSIFSSSTVHAPLGCSLPRQILPLVPVLDLTSPWKVCSNLSPASSAPGLYRRNKLIFFFYRPCTARSSCSLPIPTLPLAPTLFLVSPRNVRSNFSPTSCTKGVAKGFYRRYQLLLFFSRPLTSGRRYSLLSRHPVPLVITLSLTSPWNVHSNFSPDSSAKRSLPQTPASFLLLASSD